MSYEIPLPMPEKLLEKPILNALDLHQYLESNEFKPLNVIIDNANAKIKVYFEKEISNDKKRKLMDVVMDYYKKHIKIERG